MRHPGRRTLGRRRGDVDDRRVPRRPQARERGADRAHVAHHVQLPVGVPFLVRHLLEARLPRDPDVVDENVETAERLRRLLDGALGLPRHTQVSLHVARLADPGCLAPAAADHARALLDEQPCGRQADAVGRSGDEAGAVTKAEIHGSLAYPA